MNAYLEIIKMYLDPYATGWTSPRLADSELRV